MFSVCLRKIGYFEDSAEKCARLGRDVLLFTFVHLHSRMYGKPFGFEGGGRGHDHEGVRGLGDVVSPTPPPPKMKPLEHPVQTCFAFSPTHLGSKLLPFGPLLGQKIDVSKTVRKWNLIRVKGDVWWHKITRHIWRYYFNFSIVACLDGVIAILCPYAPSFDTAVFRPFWESIISFSKMKHDGGIQNSKKMIGHSKKAQFLGHSITP